MPKRENETVTQFAMRQIRNEILDEAIANICEHPGHDSPFNTMAFALHTDFLIKRILKMKDE